MKRLGSDLLALACIVGGAGLSVAASAALAQRASGARTAAVDCTVEARGDGPHVVVAMRTSGSDRFVVSRDIRVDGDQVCADRARFVQSGKMHEIGIDAAREAREQVRAEMERAREQLERTRVQLEGLERIDIGDVELSLDELERYESLEAEIEQRLEDAERQLEERLERLDDEVGT